MTPFQWSERGTRAPECGVVYRLPSDTAAIARARTDRASFMLRDLLGARSAWQYGIRWPTLLWPVLYPFGMAALGLLLVVVGLAWRYRARG